MKIIVAGSRDCTDYALIEEAITQGIAELGTPTEIVHGDARGVDKTAETWAKNNGYNFKAFPAKWGDLKQKNANIKSRHDKWKKKDVKYNANAGFFRNEEMAEYADALIAVDLGTGGTNHMIKTAKDKGLKVFVYKPEGLQDDEFEYSF